MSEVPDGDYPIQTGEGRFLGQELMGSVDGLAALHLCVWVRGGSRCSSGLGAVPGRGAGVRGCLRRWPATALLFQKPKGDAVLCPTPYYLTN